MSPVHPITARFASRRLAAVGLGIWLMLGIGGRQAVALERFQEVRLSSAAFGSTAGGVARAGSGGYWAAGSENTAAGLRSAVVWKVIVDPLSPSGWTVVRYALPTPAGARSRAADVAFLEGDPDQPIVVGSIYDTAGRPHAAVWKRQPSGQFANTYLDDAPGAPVAMATAVGTGGATKVALCGTGVFGTGAVHACLWRGDGTRFRRIDLGAAGGRVSEATALLDGLDGGIWRIAGSVQRADGRWVAGLMEEEGIFWYFRPLPTPAGAESRARCGARAGGSRRIGGEITLNGVTRGALWSSETGGPFVVQAAPPPAGFVNNAVLGIVFHGLGGNDTLAGGRAWNASGPSIGAGALLPRGGAIFGFPIDDLRSQEIEVEKDETHWVGGGHAEGAFVGEASPAGSSVGQAAAFLPLPVEVPSAAAISVGAAQPITVGALWNPDGQVARAGTEGVGKDEAITISGWSTARSRPGTRAPVTVRVAGRLTPQLAGTPGEVRVQVRSSVYAVWLTVGIIGSPEYFNRVFTVADPSSFAVPGGAPLLWRVVAASSAPAVLALDQVEIETAP